MSQEIVFTSARHGLRTGSTGFCTVRSTRGMPGNLAQLLERLTGYSHVFDAYGEQAKLNPVNFAHYMARVGDQRFHILARVANAPLDHTNRSNKLAHLVAIDSSDLETDLSEGPAAESMKISWVRDWSSDTEPYVLADEKQILLPMHDQPGPGVCSGWQEATGDAGWAAVLAASAESANAPVQVILPRDVGSRKETWALQLVHEALSMIPPDQRWDISYSTFFAANLPVSVTCQWQFVLDGTDAAKRARLDPRARTIDIPAIKAEKRAAPENSLTKFTAVTTRPWTSTQADASIARRRPPKSATRSRPESSEDSWSEQEDDPDTALPPRPAGKKSFTGLHQGISDRQSPQVQKPFLSRPLTLIIGLVMVAALGFLVQQGLQLKEPDKLDKIVQSAAARAESEREKQQRREEEIQEQKLEEQRRKEADDQRQQLLAMAERPPEKIAEPESTPNAELPTVPVETPSEPGLPPLQDVRDKMHRLELKIPSSGLNSGPDGPMQLARIHVTSLENFELKRIIGGQSVLKPGLDFSLEFKDRKDERVREWEVIRKSTSGIGLGGNPDVVGRFRLDERFVLSFRWDKKNEGFEIVNCLLEMEASESGTKPEREKCTLREVNRVKPVRFDPTKVEWVESLVGRQELANTTALELHCDFVNLPGEVTKTGGGVLHVGDSAKYHMKGAANGKYDRKAEIRVEFVASDQDVRLAIGLTLEIPDHSHGSGQAEVKLVPYSPKLMGKMNDDIKVVSGDLEKRRRFLRQAQMDLKNMQSAAGKLLQSKPDKETREKIQAEIDTQKKLVDDRSGIASAVDAELKELQSLEADLNTMLENIAMNGQLQFSLRLMIPDAGDRGIELVSTEEAQP